MDCYFHSHVPSVAQCIDCRKPICATCRDDSGTCPSCRLAAKVDAASATRTKIGGQVPPYASAPPPPAPPPAAVRNAQVAAMDDPPESRALVALGYPLWPLALISLFDRKQSKRLRRQAYAALGFNVAMAALAGLFSLTDMIFGSVPFITAAPTILLALMLPVFLVASVYFGIKTWNGEEVHVPILSDWIDERITA
jgi:hypothetical protein